MDLSSIPIKAVVLLCLLCCVARLWEANDMGRLTPRLVDEPALRRRLVPLTNHPNHRYLQEAYMVEVHLALYYVTEDIALAMESKDPSNPVVAHFCKNFNEQASGPQVLEAAIESGYVYQTRILDTANNGTQDYDCQVIQSNRVFVNDTIFDIPDGQFILEVFVNQIVFVMPSRTVSNDEVYNTVARGFNRGAGGRRTVSNDEVYNTVARGFNRGAGGRVRFVTLLKRMDDFSTLLDVEVIDGGFSVLHYIPSVTPSRSPTLATSSPPTQFPSNAPTTKAPTMTPSHEPSSTPSITPSSSLSSSPSSGLSLSPSTIPSSSPVASSMNPTVAPSLSPSEKPETSSPTLDPTTMFPTNQPTVHGTGTIYQPTQQPSSTGSQTAVADTSSTNDRKGLILGAIAGGVATIFVSLFFIFCVWFPLCGKRRSDQSVASERRRQQVSPSSSQSDGAEAAAAMIPGVVNLVDDNASLADTTLGDQTAGIFPPIKNKRLGETDGALNLLDSFDDNSLYTSSVAPTSALGGSSEPSEPSDQSLYSHGTAMILPSSLDNTLDYEQNIIFPMSGSASDSGGDGEEIQLQHIGHVDVDEEIQVVTVLEDSDESDLASYGKQDDGSIDPAKESKVDKSDIESEIDRDGGFNPFASIPAAESDEEKARDVSQNMDRDGYDPFADDTSGTSSFGFDNIEPLDVKSGNPYGPTQEIPDDRSSPSSDSSQTKRIEHLILGSIPHPSDHERLGAISEVENRDVDESKGDKDRKESNDSDRSPAREFFQNSEEANNTLLRTVLEDARILAESKSPSLPSRASRKSAPPRMLKPTSSGHIKPKITNAIMAEAAKPAKARGTSSTSVGGEPRPRDPRDRGEPAPKPPTRPSQNARYRGEVSNGTEDVGDPADGLFGPSDFLPLPPYRTRFLDRVAVMKPHHFVPPGSGGRSGSTPTAPPGRKNETAMKLPETHKHSTSTPAEQVEVTSVSSGTVSIPSSSGGSANGKLGAQPRSYGETWSAASDDSVMHQPSESEDSSLFTPESSPGLLGITGQPSEGKNMLDDGASSNSDGSSTDWLFDAVEQTLGPRSPAADMDSLSGRSTRSEKSHKSTRSNRSRKSLQSAEKSSSRKAGGRKHSPAQKDFPFSTLNKPSSSVVYLASETRLDEHKSESDETSITPRTLEHDLKRLQMQLADVLQTEMDQITTSSIAASSAAGSALSAKRRAAAKKSKKNHVVLVVPPGKLGVVLANRHDGKGTVVSEVRPSSSMRGVLSPGDRLVAVDGKDVTNMVVGEVTKLMASRANGERRLTVITSAPPSGRDMDEAKVEEHA